MQVPPSWGTYSKLYKKHLLAQAVDRCHRLGQTREVKVSKLIMTRRDPSKETVEQRIMAMQVRASPSSTPRAIATASAPVATFQRRKRAQHLCTAGCLVPLRAEHQTRWLFMSCCRSTAYRRTYLHGRQPGSGTSSVEKDAACGFLGFADKPGNTGP